MLILLLCGLTIVIGCFCLVFGLDHRQSAKTRNGLLLAAFICVLIFWGLTTLIWLNPLK